MGKQMTAVLFPGQGAYYGRALLDLQEAYPELVSVFAEIDSAARPLVGDLAVDTLFPAQRMRQHESKPPEMAHLLLDAPEALQLAIYAVSVAVYEVMRNRGLRPDVLVGHSLGEIAALVSAGAFTIADGAQIVCHRSLVLSEAGLGEAYMAVVATNADQAQRLLDLVGDPQTVVAVENHPSQTVLSGQAASLDTVARLAACLQLDFTRVKSPYPFHSPLLEQVDEKFAVRIRAIRQQRLQVPVYSPIVGRRYTGDDALTEILAGHFTRPVRFLQGIAELAADGTTVFVESGALDGLTKIVRRVAGSSATALPTLLPEAGGAAGIARALEQLSGLGVVSAPAVGVADLEQLRLAFLPDVPAANFAPFWAERGSHVTAFARREHAAFDLTLASGTPVNGGVAASASPAAPPAVSVPAGAGRDAILSQLTDLYATALEYPAEVFAEDTELEGELGVDSVKQTELLGRVGEQFQLPPRPADFRPGPYNTLGKIADLVLSAA
jgi:acyl transferase domain-containing protein